MRNIRVPYNELLAKLAADWRQPNDFTVIPVRAIPTCLPVPFTQETVPYARWRGRG